MQAMNRTEKPYIIAGPCSAESLKQVDYLASILKALGINAFRAGAWKPRTRPNTFEGYGEEALKWLVEIREKYKLPIAIEVATPGHIQLALKYDIDILWLGTRTTASPFTVEALAKELENSDKTIIVKNPICPDLDLWIGAIERFRNHNVTNLMAIHRGFKVYESHNYRSMPFWNIPMEFRKIFPNIPMILDPSHIAGERALIEKVIDEAQAFHFSGMMIEVHQEPDTALSDKAQQIKPDVFQTLMEKIKLSTIA